MVQSAGASQVMPRSLRPLASPIGQNAFLNSASWTVRKPYTLENAGSGQPRKHIPTPDRNQSDNTIIGAELGALNHAGRRVEPASGLDAVADSPGVAFPERVRPVVERALGMADFHPLRVSGAKANAHPAARLRPKRIGSSQFGHRRTRSQGLRRFRRCAQMRTGRGGAYNSSIVCASTPSC